MKLLFTCCTLGHGFFFMPCRFNFHDDQMGSLTANLPSPPDLRKASGHETDVPMTLITGLTHTETPSGYVSSLAPIPMPLSSSSSLPNFQTHTLLQPIQWRQRIVHTHTFEVYQYRNRTSKLVVVEMPLDTPEVGPLNNSSMMDGTKWPNWPAPSL